MTTLNISILTIETSSANGQNVWTSCGSLGVLSSRTISLLPCSRNVHMGLQNQISYTHIILPTVFEEWDLKAIKKIKLCVSMRGKTIHLYSYFSKE